ncbi:hypothetical protein [Aquabacterium sp. J223]|uniref:hypothetical protein n=1 Tax=Aquabacterium sp. J223 TaxID=2898431 RepID=UPI0021AE156D|nr:hypothetical protein [Aquabacterium sp. J223]UUX96642.1 hypothetical protein LRS07_04925 [Aquabacterium sp. J223]
MQATEPTNEKIRALAFQATEIKQASDHCSGQSETWSELNLDAFARVLVEDCISLIEQQSPEGEQGLVKVGALKTALRQRYGQP